MGVGRGEEVSRRLCLTWVRAGLFQRSVISLRFSGRSSSCSACAASSMFLQKGSSHTGLALPRGRGGALSTKSGSIPNVIQSLDAEVALPPPALCRHELIFSGSRYVLTPDRHLCLPQAWPVLAEMDSQEKAQGLLTLKAPETCMHPRARVMSHTACLASCLRRAERHCMSTSRTSLAAKHGRPSLRSRLRSCEVANQAGEGR